MNEFLLSLKKRVLIPALVFAAVAIWVVLCQAHYTSYWAGTIHRVQTTDFNLLHHTLPPTLSQLIIAGRDDLIQKVLDSTYGLFGLAVTNAAGETIVYRTNKVYHRQSWQSLATPEGLISLDEPYDLLTDPPPLAPAFEHATPRKSEAKEVGEKPAGRVLGRVYYIRAVPPTLLEDLSGFLLTGSLELSGAKRGYLYITLTTAGFALALSLIVLWRKRELEHKRRELTQIERELEIRGKALDHLTSELTAQQARKQWLEQEADRVYRHGLVLREALEKLRANLAAKPDSGQTAARARLPGSPSSLLEEIEAIIPELANNADILRTQAEEQKAHCLELELRQLEMRKIIDQAYERASFQLGNVLRFRAK